jgi:hypothetical protein
MKIPKTDRAKIVAVLCNIDPFTIGVAVVGHNGRFNSSSLLLLKSEKKVK